MEKIFLLLCLLTNTLVGFAQDASYSYRPLASDGCHVEYTALKQDGKNYLVVSVKSDEGLCFIDKPTMMLKTSEGEVIKVEGSNLGNRKESSTGYVIGNVVISGNNSVGMAQFELTNEQVEKLKLGIIKVRLATTPFIHEREFSKDKIGKKLFNAFAKQKEDDF